MSFALPWKALALAFGVGAFGLSVPATDAFAQDRREEHVPDPARGETLFRACLQCHTAAPGEVKIGPSLAGVVGRTPGSVPGFGYSQGMIDLGRSGAVWNTGTLDRFLTRPRAMIAGTKMVFWGYRKPEDRADLIAYLATIPG